MCPHMFRLDEMGSRYADRRATSRRTLGTLHRTVPVGSAYKPTLAMLPRSAGRSRRAPAFAGQVAHHTPVLRALTVHHGPRPTLGRTSFALYCLYPRPVCVRVLRVPRHIPLLPR